MNDDPKGSEANPPAYHIMSADRVAEQLGVDLDLGLSASEAEGRRATFGDNEIAEEDKFRPLLLLARQFTDIMILILAAAAIVAGLIGEVMDTVAILVIVVLIAVESEKWLLRRGLLYSSIDKM